MYVSKFEDKDTDYWNHAAEGVKWDEACRINHGQCTWYYSFMGRPERKSMMTQRIRANK